MVMGVVSARRRRNSLIYPLNHPKRKKMFYCNAVVVVVVVVVQNWAREVDFQINRLPFSCDERWNMKEEEVAHT